MIFTIKNLKYCPVLFLCMLSCNEPILEKTPKVSSDKATSLISFMGETVEVSPDFPTLLLNQSDEEFKKYYLSLHSNANLRTSADQTALSYEELGSLVSAVVAKYPDVSWEKEISATDLKRIYKDFKSITTLDQVREKSEIIVNFYDALIKQEVLPQIVEYKKSKSAKGLRTAWDPADPFGKMNAHEQSIALNHPRYSTGYVIAAGLATESSRVAGLGDNGIPTKANAMRHAAWNCFGIRNVIILGASEDTAVRYLRECTSAHEMDDFGNRIETADSAMDLNNNMVGRTWMADETGWGFGWARKMPTEARIENTMQIRAARAPKYDDTPSQIIAIVGRQGGWDVVWNNDVGSQSELVYIVD